LISLINFSQVFGTIISGAVPGLLPAFMLLNVLVVSGLVFFFVSFFVLGVRPCPYP
jgi:hypothetical protein